MHFVIYLPPGFYAATAAAISETLQAINEQTYADNITYEFVSGKKRSVSRSGLSFKCNTQPSRKMDILIMLSGLRAGTHLRSELICSEMKEAMPLLDKAQTQHATIAATCGASGVLAASGLLDGKKATISWWLKKEAKELFPEVKWEPSRILVRDGNIYTSGGGFSGLELITTLLSDLGFGAEERIVRKLLVFPPARQFQSPYEFPLEVSKSDFEGKLNIFLKEEPAKLSVPYLASHLGMSTRTLSRKFLDELGVPPGKWIQQKRIDMAITLLEETDLNVSEICYSVGYEDVSSFTRLFTRNTGMSPNEFKKQVNS